MTAQLEKNKIANRYAKAVFEDAVQAQEEEQTQEQLQTVKSLLEKMPEFLSFFEAPGIPKTEKLLMLHQQFDTVFSTRIIRLLSLMIENNRIFALGTLINAYETLLNKHRHIATGEVISVVPLPPKLRKQLSVCLAQMGGYQQVQLHNTLDPKILGGLVIKIEDKLIDGSYLGELNRLHEKLSYRV